MNKEILISTKPQHCYTKLIGKKTIEVRKRVPKWVLEEIAKGNKVWFNEYVTKANPFLMQLDKNTYVTYDLTEKYRMKCDLNGTIPYRYLVSKIDEVIVSASYYDGKNWHGDKKDGLEEYYKLACISENEFHKYSKGANIYAIHIDKIEIFDEPMKLSDFYTYKKKMVYCGFDCPPYEDYIKSLVTRAPQNCQTVWVKE